MGNGISYGRHCGAFYAHAGLLLAISLFLGACTVLRQGGGAAENVAFFDDFSDPLGGNWHLEADAVGQAEIVDGRLLLSLNGPATAQYVTLEDQVFSDFIADVEATQVGGPAGGSFGLLVRMPAPGQFYRFEITSNGEYVVERHDGPAEWERLTEDWQTSAAILTGLSQTNHLRVAASGGTFSFYANDMLLVQVVDGTYEVGAIAVDAGTFNQNELRVAFDNVVISVP
ncbi:MAG TPA: hypothetical protein VE553_10515 [Candidatus Binatia bacterium]|nr:hypothetical protein [Candidatus Binatia bacterium]